MLGAHCLVPPSRRTARRSVPAFRGLPVGPSCCQLCAMTLAEILSDKDFGLQMRFVRDDVAAFFRPGERNAEVLAERRDWLEEAPQTYRALLPPGEDVLDETIGLAVDLGTLPEGETRESFAELAPLDR